MTSTTIKPHVVREAGELHSVRQGNRTTYRTLQNPQDYPRLANHFFQIGGDREHFPGRLLWSGILLHPQSYYCDT